MNKNQGKLYRKYCFNDGTSYKAEAGKDGVTDEDMRNLKNVIQSGYKSMHKQDKLTIISIEAGSSFDDGGETKPLEFADPTADVQIIIETSNEYEELYSAIKNLLPQQQELINAIYWSGVSIAEYARQNGVTEGAIRDRLRKAQNKIKKYLN